MNRKPTGVLSFDELDNVIVVPASGRKEISSRKSKIRKGDLPFNDSLLEGSEFMPTTSEGSENTNKNSPSFPRWTKETTDSRPLKFLKNRGFESEDDDSFGISMDDSFRSRSFFSSSHSSITRTSSVSWNRISAHRRRHSLSSSSDEGTSPLSRLVFVLETTPSNPPRGRSLTRKRVNSFHEVKKEMSDPENNVSKRDSYQREGSMRHILKLIGVKGSDDSEKDDCTVASSDIASISESDCRTIGSSLSSMTLPSFQKPGSKEPETIESLPQLWGRLSLPPKEPSYSERMEKKSQVLTLAWLLARAIELEKKQHPSKKRRCKNNLQQYNLICAYRYICPQHRRRSPAARRLGFSVDASYEKFSSSSMGSSANIQQAGV